MIPKIMNEEENSKGQAGLRKEDQKRKKARKARA